MINGKLEAKLELDYHNLVGNYGWFLLYLVLFLCFNFL